MHSLKALVQCVWRNANVQDVATGGLLAITLSITQRNVTLCQQYDVAFQKRHNKTNEYPPPHPFPPPIPQNKKKKNKQNTLTKLLCATGLWKIKILQQF